ncbi:MAG: sugar transferase [Planctomycetota bacterium]
MSAFRSKPLAPFGNLIKSERYRQPLETPVFFRTLAREKGRAERTGEPLTLIVLGITDSFEEDREVLLDFLQKRLRLTDELGWMDENHLGVLLPATTGYEARIVAGSIGVAMGAARERFSCIVYSDSPGSPEDLGSEEEDVEIWDGEIEPLSPLFLVPMPTGKRVLDVVGAGLLLLLAMPVMMLTAIAIRLESRGPIIFRQTRLGQGGSSFTLLKFRSMVVDAEELQAKLAEENRRDGPAFKIADDPRITKVGRFIRASGIDELPQIINVLRGEMTLVGPRPPIPHEVHSYEEWQKARLRVVGGLTCIWQVDGRLENVSFRDWMRMDIRYGSNFSPKRDLGLIARTAWVVLFARGDH